MGLERPQGRGRLLLWHGAPGAGNTTAIRALMRAWKPWCESCYIADPERLFEQAHHLNELLTLRSSDSSGDRWNLVVAEDTDAYLRNGADNGSSAAMGRLLNAADGILGQGANALILLTTNEPLARLHPAITRPGRCLAIVEFDRFNDHEAREFLGPDIAVPSGGSATLAELLASAGDIGQVEGSEPEAEPVGVYL